MMSREDYEANWNRPTDGQTDGKDHILSQADALTKHNVPVRYCICEVHLIHRYCICEVHLIHRYCICEVLLLLYPILNNV